MKVLICDDEKIHLDILENELRNYQAKTGIELQISRACTGLEALESAGSEVFDAAFLDIGLKDMNGIEVVERIRTFDKKIPLIFVTSHGQFRDKAFDLFAFNYLTKPIEAGKFEKVMDRLVEMVERPSRMGIPYSYKENGELHRVDYRDILYFEKCRNHMVLHTAAQVITMQKTIKELVKELDPAVFLQCHQGFVVNMQKIRSVKASEIEMIGLKKKIPVGRTFHKATMQRVMQLLQKRGWQ